LLHVHGSNNPNGVTSNGDRVAMHPFFVFKDLVTIFAFFLFLSIIVFFYPNLLGQWPNIILLIVNIIYICAVCWKDILYYNYINIVKIYNKTINISDLFIIKIFSKYIIEKINPIIVKYYYKIYNQQITKIINNNFHYIYNFNYFKNINNLKYFKYLMIYLLLVGISETLRTNKNNIINYLILQKKFFSNNLITDNHNNEISLEFKQ
jgi:quinol-cytochrome oxidoreductase complex cytochrome b subunit